MTQTPIVFLDTETTSLHPTQRLAWEVGFIRRDPDGTQTETLMQISDVDLRNADPTALRIGGFFERYGRFLPGYKPEGPYIGDDEVVVVPKSVAWVTTRQAAEILQRELAGAVVIGANPQFDTTTLEPMLRANGACASWHYRPVCIEAIAYGYLLGAAAAERSVLPEIPLPWRSDHLASLLPVEPTADEDRHTAMGDARWVMRWYDAMTGGAA